MPNVHQQLIDAIDGYDVPTDDALEKLLLESRWSFSLEAVNGKVMRWRVGDNLLVRVILCMRRQERCNLIGSPITTNLLLSSHISICNAREAKCMRGNLLLLSIFFENTTQLLCRSTGQATGEGGTMGQRGSSCPKMSRSRVCQHDMPTDSMMMSFE